MEIMHDARSGVQGDPNANFQEGFNEHNACASDIIVDTGSETALDRGDSKNWFDWTVLIRKSENFFTRKKRSRSIQLKVRSPAVPTVHRKYERNCQSGVPSEATETYSDLLSAIRADVEKYEKTGIVPTCNINPFYHRVYLNTLQKLKLTISIIFVLPFRAIFVFLTLALAWFTAFLSTFGLSEEELATKPLPRWRGILRWLVAKVLMRIAFFFAGFHWAATRGKQATAKEAPIVVVAPHSSVFDAYLVILLGGPSIVARLDVHSLPLIGRMVDMTQAIYVGREDASSRQSSVQEITKRALSNGTWPQVFIFPEGTCSNRTALIKFKLGAFLPGVPIQPVIARWPNKIDGITWTFDGIPPWKNFFLSFTQFTNHLQLEFLPVYYPGKDEQNNAQLYAHNVQRLMSQALRIPATDFSYEDGLILVEMRSSPLPDRLTSLAKFRSNLRHPIALKELDLLDDLIRKTSTDWTLGPQELIKFYGAEVDVTMLLGESQNPIDFRDYFIQIILTHPGVSVEKVISLVLTLYGDIPMITDTDIRALLHRLLLIPEDILRTWMTKGVDASHQATFKNKTIKLWQFAKTFGMEASVLYGQRTLH